MCMAGERISYQDASDFSSPARGVRLQSTGQLQNPENTYTTNEDEHCGTAHRKFNGSQIAVKGSEPRCCMSAKVELMRRQKY